jgi:hypothetical protein
MSLIKFHQFAIMIFSENCTEDNFCRTLCIIRYSKNQKTQRFGNWMLPFSGDGETPNLLGPLETAKLNYWATLVRVRVRVRVKLALRRAVYRQSFRLGAKHLENANQRFSFLATEPLRA